MLQRTSSALPEEKRSRKPVLAGPASFKDFKLFENYAASSQDILRLVKSVAHGIRQCGAPVLGRVKRGELCASLTPNQELHCRGFIVDALSAALFRSFAWTEQIQRIRFLPDQKAH